MKGKLMKLTKRSISGKKGAAKRNAISVLSGVKQGQRIRKK